MIDHQSTVLASSSAHGIIHLLLQMTNNVFSFMAHKHHHHQYHHHHHHPPHHHPPTSAATTALTTATTTTSSNIKRAVSTSLTSASATSLSYRLPLLSIAYHSMHHLLRRSLVDQKGE
jgi:hypothetical protein